MTRKSDELAKYVTHDNCRAVLSAAFDVIDEITHHWRRSGLEDKCAACGLPPEAMWHRRAMDIVAPPKPADTQEALL